MATRSRPSRPGGRRAAGSAAVSSSATTMVISWAISISTPHCLVSSRWANCRQLLPTQQRLLPSRRSHCCSAPAPPARGKAARGKAARGQAWTPSSRCASSRKLTLPQEICWRTSRAVCSHLRRSSRRPHPPRSLRRRAFAHCGRGGRRRTVGPSDAPRHQKRRGIVVASSPPPARSPRRRRSARRRHACSWRDACEGGSIARWPFAAWSRGGGQTPPPHRAATGSLQVEWAVPSWWCHSVLPRPPQTQGRWA